MRTTLAPQEIMARDRSWKAAASCDLVEVGELHLHRQGSAEGAGLLALGPDIIGHGRDAGLDFIRRCQIALEGGLGTGGFSLAIGNHRPIILAVRDGEIPGGRFAKMLLQKGERPRSQICAHLDP
jgi:hypothetical protein